MYVPTTKPFTSMILQDTIAKLVLAYPFIRVVSIGESRMGRPIFALTVGPETMGMYGHPAVLVNASHHANEWITSVIAMKFLEDYCQRPQNDITLHIIPMVNPDGVDIVTNGLNPLHPVYQRAEKMASESMCDGDFPNCWKANATGVDLNSNYPANWEITQRAKFSKGYTKPGPRDFVGDYPLCEPESAAMAAYTVANDFALTVSLHTQGEEIYWRYMHYNPPGAKELATRMADASGYIMADVPDETSHGGYRDWFIATFNRPGFTVECGFGESPLPISDFDGIYKKTAPLLWEALK